MLHAYETSPMLSNPISARRVAPQWPAQRMAHTVRGRRDQRAECTGVLGMVVRWTAREKRYSASAREWDGRTERVASV